ncbi:MULTISPECIES: hypothetical protein [Methylosinus]|uniref:hypothetical protein n=1 Tax=Methylosinus TaxID=425 RepID=UPI0012DDDBEA|nr:MULTISPECIES: hypothetical protein [Methylosinus]
MAETKRPAALATRQALRNLSCGKADGFLNTAIQPSVSIENRRAQLVARRFRISETLAAVVVSLCYGEARQ